MRESRTGTWFQTPEAYRLFASMPELFRPFAIAVERVKELESERVRELVGICSGYVTVERNPIKQFFTRRAIIMGGPCLADDATEEEVEFLMRALKTQLQISNCRFQIYNSPIYIETRNFNDYGQWRGAFEKAGFEYRKHLNFHVHTNHSWENVEANIGKHRQRYIRLSLQEGVTVKELKNEGVNELENIKLLKDFYAILQYLYRTKVKTPLYPWSFFENLYRCDSCRYLLAVYQGRVIGGSVCMLLPGRCMYEWFACGCDGEYKNIYPSSVAKYAGMKYAVDHGYPIFDMMGAGEPGVPYGVRDFKAEFGGEMVEHGRFVCVNKPLLYSIGKVGVRILRRNYLHIFQKSCNFAAFLE